MVSFDTSIPSPGRVVIYGRKGALAGDLAAGLSGVFQVEQVATLPEAVHALVEPTLALLVIADDAAAVSDPTDCEILVHRRRCRAPDGSSRARGAGLPPGRNHPGGQSLIRSPYPLKKSPED